MRTLVIIFMSLITLSLCAQTKEIDSLKSILPASKSTAKIKILIDLCWEFRKVNADSARSYGLKGLALARERKIDSLEVEALHNIGITLEAQGNYKEALSYELPALELRKKLGNDARTANTLNNLGIIYDETGNPKQSLEYYYQARKIYERLGDKAKIAMVISNIGIVLKAQREYVKVIPYYHEALGIYKQLQNDFGIAACHTNLGSVYYFTQNYDSALYYSLLSTEEFRQQNNLQFLPTTLSNAAQAYSKLGRTQEAKESLLEAQKLNEQFDNKFDLSEVLINLSALYRNDNNYPQAHQTATRALAIAESIDARKLIMDAHWELSAIEEGRQNFQAALREYKYYDQQEDSLFQQDKTRQIAELQTQYETEKKEKEISIQKLQLSEHELMLERNQTLIIGLIVLLILLSVVFVLQRSRMKLKEQKIREEQHRKHQEELTQSVIDLQERERARFAQDLHDGFGQMVTTLKFHLESPQAGNQNTNALIAQMHDEIRNVSFALWPQVLVRDGLVQAIQELADRLNKSGKVLIEIKTLGLTERLTSNTEITLYRICQEWLTNILKHSSSTKITIQLVAHPDELVFTIEDNGHGFDAKQLEKGNGWKNIQSRANLLKAELDLDTQVNRIGTIFTVALPQHTEISTREVA